jgi:hypothetical protein
MSKLDDMIVTLIEKGIDVFEKTGEFAIDQAPELLQEFYMWQTATHLFWVGFGVLLWIIGVILPFYWVNGDEGSNKYFWKRGYQSEVEWAKGVNIVGLIAGLIIILINSYHLIFLYVAPKIYLIEHFFRMTRGN